MSRKRRGYEDGRGMVRIEILIRTKKIELRKIMINFPKYEEGDK